MKITGNFLYRYLAQKTHQPFTNFLGGTVKANRLFADGILAILENRFDGVEFQKYRDEINFLISTGKTYSVNNNQIYEAPLQVIDVTFQVATATIKTYLPHNLVDGDTVNLSGIQLTIVPNINASFVVTVVDDHSFTIPFTWTSGVYTANTGVITYSKMIADYWQMIQVSARYDVLYSGVTITNASNTTPIIITLNKRTDNQTGSYDNISNVGGNTNANGDFYLRKLNDFQYALYEDKYFLTPTVGNGTFVTGSGKISKINYKTCKPFLPGTKISPLGQPSADAPRYKDSERMLKFFPQDILCKEIVADYYRRPDVMVDVSDDVTDLTMYFSEHFLMGGLLNTVTRLFGEESRDILLTEQAQQELKLNN